MMSLGCSKARDNMPIQLKDGACDISTRMGKAAGTLRSFIIDDKSLSGLYRAVVCVGSEES